MKTMAANKIAYVDNTGKGSLYHHSEIMQAIRSGGQFSDDLADIFALRSVVMSDGETRWILEWA
jgi:hypothetical protein